jgi:hypothetical protein
MMDSKVFEDVLPAAGFDVRDEEVEVEVEVGTDMKGKEGKQRKGGRMTNGAATLTIPMIEGTTAWPVGNSSQGEGH